jgi:D-alanyl-D-alanine dipeptidase
MHSVVPEREPFVDVEKYTEGKISTDMQYYKQGRRGAITTAYLRKSVADRLLIAAELLPCGYTLKIFDAWRPSDVQKSLYYEYFEKLRRENPELEDERLHLMARTFVSFPDKEKRFSYVHSSGGAVDLTIVDPNGVELDMGTHFDEFSPLSSTFAPLEEHSQAKQNRKMLYNAMTKAGFTNYSSEWWHYDYGDVFWSEETKNSVKYPSVYTEDEILELNNYGRAVEI